jgi:hypothetical protein
MKRGLHPVEYSSGAETEDWNILKVATNERDLLNAKMDYKTRSIKYSNMPEYRLFYVTHLYLHRAFVNVFENEYFFHNLEINNLYCENISTGNTDGIPYKVKTKE